jgi:hypothetical protein
MQHAPDEDAVAFRQHLKKDRVAKDVQPARRPSQLPAWSVKQRSISGTIDRLDQTSDHAVGRLWPSLNVDVTPNIE